MRALSGGRNAFLADEGHYFDRITQMHSTGFMLIAGVILACVAVGLYEGLAFGFAKLIPPVEVEE
jgi:NADH:ubiquinone oxidoreductase subunit F (NADH-binding)